MNKKKSIKIKKRQARLILDTNFLLIPYQFHVDIFSELERVLDVPYQLCITQGTLDELKKLLQSSKQKERLAAKLAMEFIKKMAPQSLRKLFLSSQKQKNLKILPSSSHKHNDDAIVEMVSSDDIVATQDKLLKKRLKEKNIKIASLKQKKYIVVHNP